MALIKCHDCGRDVSNDAKKCPNCGAPVQKSTLYIVLAMIPVLILLFFVTQMLEKAGLWPPFK